MENLEKLTTHLSHLERVAVAFSGGVDSALLLRVARDTLGADKVLALTAVTQLVPDWERREARELAEALGVTQHLFEEDVLRNPDVAGNPRDRCYHCKRHVFTLFREHCAALGIPHLLDGTNLDDLGEDRPGLKALQELGVRSPLAECHIDKQSVRAMSRVLGLPTAERPSFACLATRVPFGTPLTEKVLTRVAQCESFLRECGLQEYRVRYHDAVARIEIPSEEMLSLLTSPLREQLVQRFKEFGFTYVTLDLEGLRSGSMSEVDTRGGTDAEQ